MRYELRLATSPRHRLRQAAMTGLALGTLLAFGFDTASGPLPQPRFWIIFLTSSVIIGMLFHRFLALRGGFMPVRLDLGQATLRMSTGRGLPLWEIPFRSMQITRPEDNPREGLVIDGPGIRFLLNARHLVALDGQEIEDPIDALTLLEHQLTTRSRDGSSSTEPTVAESGPSPIASASVRPVQAFTSGTSPGPATLTLSAILGLVFILQWRLGAISDPMTLLALGANSNPLVLAGEWQRLITGNLLHGDLRHLLFNGFALISFGRIVEARLGTSRFLVIFLGACLGGATASAFLNDVLISIGASTGILGLVGAYGTIDWYFANDRQAALRRQGILLFLALALPALLVPNADHFGHAGGLLVGLLLTAWLLSPLDAVTPRMLDAASRSSDVSRVLSQWLPGGRLPDAKQRQSHASRLRLAKILATGGVLLFVGVSAWTGWHYANQGTRSEALALLAVPDLPHFFINNAAWTLAIDPQTTTEQLKSARLAMAWAENPETEPASAEIDTLATLTYRLGDFDHAIELQRRAFAMDPDEVIAAQLARFEMSRLTRLQAPFVEGFDETPEAIVSHRAEEGCGGPQSQDQVADAAPGITVRLQSVASAEDDTVKAPVGSPEIHVLLQRGEVPSALLQINLTEGSPDHVLCSDIPSDLWSCEVEARVSLATSIPPMPWIDPPLGAPKTPKNGPAEAVGSSCQLFRLDAETLTLPGPI